MDFIHLDSSEMKENLDANILHLAQNKNAKIQNSKCTKRQVFREIDDANNKNRLIKKTAYILDSEEEGDSPLKKQSKGGMPHRSIDQVSEIKESISRDVSSLGSPKITPKKPISECNQHKEHIYSYNYCIQCSIYMLCQQCVKSQHSDHMILTFSSEQQSKCLTKQFLIQKIQESLQKLKSKQNDLKNKSAQLQLIAVNVKKIQDQVIDKLQRAFREISNLVRTVYQKEQLVYEQKIQEFYYNFNIVGQQIRQNLLTIIDESFDIHNFNPSSINKQPPLVPNQQMNKFKSTLQKTKRFYKSIIESIEELRTKTEKFSNLYAKNNKQAVQVSNGSRKNSIKKYEKFLAENCFGQSGQETKSSLIRILDTMSK